jgi:(5-formylfuran-3-yl)methyl phosphate synthase
MSGATLPRGLLVSVRSPEEANAALAGGADIIDVKEPSRGPLGCADPEVTAAILAVVAARTPVTLACGELADCPEQLAEQIAMHLEDICIRLVAGQPPPVAVKAGPGRLSPDRWRGAFERLRAALPPGTEAVAVAYADWERAGSARPDVILAAAAAAGGHSLLIDTSDKSGPGLFDAAGVEAIQAWVRQARLAGLRLALAGRLSSTEVEAAFRLGGEIIGVRSAVCTGGRHGRVDSQLVAKLAAAARGRPVAPP